MSLNLNNPHRDFLKMGAFSANHWTNPAFECAFAAAKDASGFVRAIV